VSDDKNDEGEHKPEGLPPGVLSANQQARDSVMQAVQHQHYSTAAQMLTGSSMNLSAFSSIPSIAGPLPADHPFYVLVGRVASEWAHLEHNLDLSIWAMLDASPDQAACITSQMMGVGPRCNAIQLLGALRSVPDECLKSFRQLKNDSYSVADWHARWIHDPWYLESSSGKVSQFRAMPMADPRYGQQDISSQQVEDRITEIKKLQDRATLARGKLVYELGALRQKPT
jgi:hypothetical protein